MSDSQGSEHYQMNDGKENRRRRQRSEGGCGGTGSWQIASNSRCIACGRIGALCECQTSRIDPQLKRQKLETFLLNTPYVRCKQLKALDDVGREESRHRHRLVEQSVNELQMIAHIAFTQRRLLSLVLEEATSREAQVATERKEWIEIITFLDRHVVLLALMQREREERLRLHALANREVQMVVAWHNATFHLLRLYSREYAFRDALVNHEAAERAALKSLEMGFLNMAESNKNARQCLYKEFSEQRELLFSEWHGTMEAIRCAVAADLQHIQQVMHARSRLNELCWKQKLELDAEEKKARQHLYDVAVEESCVVMEKVRVCKQQRDLMMNHEAMARAAIFQDAVGVYAMLLEEFKQGMREVRNLEELKWQQREGVLRAAIQQIQCIAVEEAQEVASLKAWERSERDQRYQWMLEMGRQRCEVEQVSLLQTQLLFKEEQDARQKLISLMRDTEVVIAAWLQQKARKLQELVATVLMQKGEMRLQEHEERFALVSHKAEHEVAVRRWIEQRETVRQAVVAEEEWNRAKRLEAEHAERENMAWCFAAELDACHTALQERMETLVRFQQRAMISLQGIVEQEMAALLLVQRAAKEDMERALHEEHYRRLLDVLNTETEHRSCMVQQEVRHRESIFTQMALQESFFTKEAQEHLKARICEVEVAEEGQRRVLQHMAGEATERLCLEYRQSFEDALCRAEKRLREELRQREIALAEGARLYRDDEELTLRVDDASPEETGHQQGHQNCANQITIPDESWDIQRRFVLTELGGEENDAVLLAPPAVTFLADVLNRISRLESLRRADMQQAELAANAVRRKVMNQKQALSETMGRLEESREKLGRDAAEHNARAAMRRDARQRMSAQLERERTRLQTKTEELRHMRSVVCGMREAIHNQYQKR